MTPTPLRRAALAAALLAVAVLAACEEGRPKREPLRVRTAAGGTVDLSGTRWEGCFPLPGGGSFAQRQIHGEEGAVTFVETPYGTADCSGAPSADGAATFSAIAIADGAAQVGWSGGAAPEGLTDAPLVTRVFLGGVDFVGTDVYLVDDRAGAPRRLYTGDPAGPVDGDGYWTLLLPVPAEEVP